MSDASAAGIPARRPMADARSGPAASRPAVPPPGRWALQQEALQQEVERARASGRRIRAVEFEGQRFWVKIARGKPWVVQISKGSPRRALAREIALMRAMHGIGAPVPELVLHGEDHYVIRDAGSCLSTLVQDAPEDPGLPALLAATGRALARMHRSGLAHGRPYLRDICWHAATRRITFIDFERGARLDAGPARLARDVALLVLSIYALRPDARGAALAQACLDAYFADAPAAMRDACARFARRWGWLPILTAPMRWHEARFRQDRRWKEYMAAPLALAHLRRVSRPA
jgi:tRNA A-37 threonylcarbamoyl transferase component Bud32